MKKAKLLIIEDNEIIRNNLCELLSEQGYEIVAAENGMTGISYASEDTDLVILDIMLPDISGITVCRKLREKTNVPILFLTARITESDKLIGFEAGADDYLTKPFSFIELGCRIQALLRRYQQYNITNNVQTKTNVIEERGVKVSSFTNEVSYHGETINLTDIEYRILRLLIEFPDKVFSVQNIYESVWDEPFYYDNANTVMVHIRKIRAKFAEIDPNAKIIQTVWGRGYRF